MIFKQPCLFQVADKVPFLQTDRNWIDIFHQLILFIIILGRWMLPKASGVTRDQLSQILLTFIGVGADILEFVTETMKVWTLLTSPDLKPDVYRNLKCVANFFAQIWQFRNMILLVLDQQNFPFSSLSRLHYFIINFRMENCLQQRWNCSY